MIHESVEKFQSIAPLLLPELIGSAKPGETEIYDEHAILPYILRREFSVDDVLDMFEDEMEMVVMYHSIASADTDYGQQICAYSNPDFGHMYKINSTTNGRGMIDQLVVTIYASMEFMGVEILRDYDMHEERYEFRYKKERNEIVAEFC